MRSRSVGVSRSLAWVALTAALALWCLAPTLSGSSTLAVPVLLTTLLAAVLAFVVATSRLDRTLPPGATAANRGGDERRDALRQCHPDAAGHVRARAPATPAGHCAG